MLTRRVLAVSTILALTSLAGASTANSTCHLVHSLPNYEQCNYALQNCADHQVGQINYFYLYYCTSSSTAIRDWIVLPFIFAILFYLFVFLGITAGEFLCPNLSVISNYLTIPENISGLTLLAFGNGSPDILSTYSSFQTANASLAIGELIGSAFFITGFIIGVITITMPFEILPQVSVADQVSNNLLISSAKFVYLRDLLFFLLSITTLLAFLSNGHLSKTKLNILVAIYIFYVLVVLIWQYLITKKRRELVQDYQIRNLYNDEAFITMDGDNLEFEDSYTFNPRILNSIEFGNVLEMLSENQSVPVNISRLVNDAQNYESRLLEHEINLEEEPEYSSKPLKTIFGYISYPLVLLLKYTIPMMSLSDFNQTVKPSFTRLMELLCSLSCAQFIIIYSFAENASWGTYAIFLVLTTLTVAGVYYNVTRANSQSNLVKLSICIIGFITAIAYIAFIADELINVLKFISVLTQLSDAIMGLTIFAIGNSVGDLISNLVIANVGYPLMALAACFGGPLLNLLLGIGVNGKIIGEVDVNMKPSLYLTCLWILVNLVFMLIYIPYKGWRFTRDAGIFMVSVWVIGTFLNIVLELV
ncbi:uncharacterized protein OGAPODRAFT_93213 [Ogataea polymorpha]|uniref:uncharacterized protein n=1 Tax=Ogataea polymorpha TaxID=460523 RepID=UPI0007F4D640|nr:uncharacterized protein OGAPODRAFT_93213 [Ogataea polymorpha]OBA16200.1 hypothetical protein OGAPODRAFT_93213 [Ogataea polymorpha]